MMSLRLQILSEESLWLYHQDEMSTFSDEAFEAELRLPELSGLSQDEYVEATFARRCRDDFALPRGILMP